MLMKIGGDTLALDAKIRRQIESECQKLAERFPDDPIDANVTIAEEFDPRHGHRIRCELSAKLGAGRQVVIRDACKTAAQAIEEVFSTARRNIRRLRRQSVLNSSASQSAAHGAAQIVGG